LWHCAHDSLWLRFSELFLTGYDIGSAELSRLAIEGTIERGVLQQVALTAQRNRIAILIPCQCTENAALMSCVITRYNLPLDPELVMNGANRVVYNSAALIDHTGRLVTNYRKTHLWSNYEKDVFTEVWNWYCSSLSSSVIGSRSEGFQR
jgi:predicted amidohydrolase